MASKSKVKKLEGTSFYGGRMTTFVTGRPIANSQCFPKATGFSALGVVGVRVCLLERVHWLGIVVAGRVW